MQESLAFVAGYGIKCYLICQDLGQLKSRESLLIFLISYNSHIIK